MKNILTVDVEEHFQVEAFQHVITPEQWERRQSRLTMNLIRLLDIFDQYGARATFFVLGWVAERYPHLIAMIRSRGHDLACHGHWHKSIKKMSPEEFRDDLQKALAAIKSASGVKVNGYRAPTFSADRKKEWIWEALIDNGIEYDSSIYPIKHDLYGDPTAPRFPYFMSFKNGVIFEIPPTTYRVMGKSLASCGGGSLRVFPYWYTKRALSAYNARGYAAMVYMHPWEIDPSQPRERVGFRSRARHYTNLHRMEAKLRRLLSEYEFAPVSEVYSDFKRYFEELEDKGVSHG